MIPIEVGMAANMVHVIHCMDVMPTKVIPVVVQLYTRIGLIDIKTI